MYSRQELTDPDLREWVKFDQNKNLSDQNQTFFCQSSNKSNKTNKKLTEQKIAEKVFAENKDDLSGSEKSGGPGQCNRLHEIPELARLSLPPRAA